MQSAVSAMTPRSWVMSRIDLLITSIFLFKILFQKILISKWQLQQQIEFAQPHYSHVVPVVVAVKVKADAKLTEGEVKTFCKTNLHDWKCPKEVVFLDDIPRNTMGKVLKEKVKEIFVD